MTQRFRSLEPFSEIELPKFTLLTGLNGSGKTQLLRALNLGHARIDALPKVTNFNQEQYGSMVPYFDSREFSASTSSNYEQFHNLSDRDGTADWIHTTFTDERQRWKEWGESNGLTTGELVELTKTVVTTPGIVLSGDIDLQDSLRELLIGLEASAKAKFPVLPSQHIEGVNRATTLLLLPPFLLTRTDVQTAFLDTTPFFGSSIGTIFSRYRDRVFRNRMKRMASEEGASISPLSSSEFEHEYGPPPWDTINQTLQKLGLDVFVDTPDPLTTGPFITRLRKSSGEMFSFDQLSSGETIIFNLALCGYQTTNKSERIESAKVVLLDEVDSPLHPSMVRTFLSIVSEVLIDRFGMSVIATTHSPSTVALFPGESLFVMEKGIPGIRQVSKATALGALTEGVPTLSVSVDGRRQVFAESPVEAGNLDILYQRMKPSIRSDRSLQFIPTGTKEANSGREIVERIVRELVTSGNSTVFGIIDWDLKNKPADRVIVLAHGSRYALENILLDPLVIALAIYRHFPEKLSYFGLNSALSYSVVARLDQATVQPLVEAVALRLFGGPPVSTRMASYDGGLSLQIDERCMTYDAHKLERLVADKYPVFEGVQRKGSGQLTEYMATKVLEDLPGAVPSEVRAAFLTLLA